MAWPSARSPATQPTRPRAEIYEATKELTHIELRAFRDDLYAPVAKDSDFGFKILPPDFTFTPLRSGETLPDIYRSIAAGIGGTAMPTWKNVLPEADLWALAHYVASLVALRGTPAADQLHAAAASISRPGRRPRSTADADGASDGGDATEGALASGRRPAVERPPHRPGRRSRRPRTAPAGTAPPAPASASASGAAPGSWDTAPRPASTTSPIATAASDDRQRRPRYEAPDARCAPAPQLIVRPAMR